MSNPSKSRASRFSFTSTSSTSSTSSPNNPSISRTTTNNSNNNALSRSPTKPTTTNPRAHYRPAPYHAPSTTDIELDPFEDTHEHYWENVRLNSHLSVDAWKTQSKVAQKTVVNARKASKDSNSSVGGDEEGYEGESDASSSRGRARGRARRRSGEHKIQPAQRCAGWKVRGLSWTLGVTGV